MTIDRIRRGNFTLQGLADELAARGLKVDYKTMCTFVHAQDLSFKKTVRAAEQHRPDVARRRDSWRKFQPRIAIERLVFIDATWAKTNMAPIRGWGRKGERLVAHVHHGH
jgi:hypothetical protein